MNGTRIPITTQGQCHRVGVDFGGIPSHLPHVGTDMGNVSYVVPSVHPTFDIGRPVPNHTEEFTEAAGVCPIYVLNLNVLYVISL